MEAQSDDCNKLGAWLWYIEITGFQTHAQIADTLSALGVKRIYVKVADGSVNTNNWPELIDVNLVNTYKSRGLEVWAWSYNYPNNPNAQAEALYKAAQTGYEGFVLDVEMEFDGLSTQVTNLFTAFANKRQQAITDGHANSNFKIYCTTWGNPDDHNFRIDLINPHVDGFMPQTYVEAWGQSYVNNLEYWINAGNVEYASLGSTKPIHHIASLEEGGMTAAQINRFIDTSGSETSIWRIPGGGVSTSLWNTWNNINWNTNFCTPSSVETLSPVASLMILPNPTTDVVNIQTGGQAGSLQVFNSTGGLIYKADIGVGTETYRLELGMQPKGIYQILFRTEQGLMLGKVVR